MRTVTQQLERLVNVLTDRTGISWTLGYLGNCSGIPGTPAYRDERRWYAFAAHSGRVGTPADSIGGFADPADLIPWLQGAVSLTTVLAQPR